MELILNHHKFVLAKSVTLFKITKKTLTGNEWSLFKINKCRSKMTYMKIIFGRRSEARDTETRVEATNKTHILGFKIKL